MIVVICLVGSGYVGAVCVDVGHVGVGCVGHVGVGCVCHVRVG